MSIQLQKKHISIASGRLQRFKWRGDVANFRCPYCGDSKKKANICRGFLYPKEGQYNYSCKNCGVGKNFDTFMIDWSPDQYQSYKLERIHRTQTIETVFKQVSTSDATQVAVSHKTLPDLARPLTALSDGHLALEYVKARLIPEDKWHDIWWSDLFGDLVRECSKKEAYSKLRNEPRLIFPLRTKDDEIFGLVGRSLNPDSTMRYMTIKFKEDDHPKLFGLNTYNTSSTLGYTVEGPIDSFFLPNCLAMTGSEIDANSYCKIVRTEQNIIVLDNEPRNLQIVHRMEKFALAGFKVCIWSGISEDLKDLNDMVIAGMSSDMLVSSINDRAVGGIRFRAELQRWRKS